MKTTRANVLFVAVLVVLATGTATAFMAPGTGDQSVSASAPAQVNTASGSTASGSTAAGDASQRPSFEVSNLSAPSNATAGDTITVTADVTNPSERPMVQAVEFRLQGDVVERRFWALNPGETNTLTFEVDTANVSPGQYVHGVYTRDSGEIATITVEEAETPETETPATETPATETPATETPETETPITETPETPETPETETPMTETPATETPETETPETETPATETPATETPATETPATETPSAPEGPAVQFEDQTLDGDTVTIASVTLPEGGFVAVVNQNGQIVGASDYLEAGTHSNVEVQVTRPNASSTDGDGPQNQSALLVAIAHRDSNFNQELDFVSSGGSIDGPYLDNGRIVLGYAVVDVESQQASQS